MTTYRDRHHAGEYDPAKIAKAEKEANEQAKASTKAAAKTK